MPAPQAAPTLPKVATGITGFDDLTYGGLPAGRPFTNGTKMTW